MAMSMTSQQSKPDTDQPTGLALIFVDKRNVLIILTLSLLCFIAGVLLADIITVLPGDALY